MLKPNSLFRCLSKKDHRQKNKGDEKQVVVTKTSNIRLPTSRRNNYKDGMVVASTASRLPHSTQQPQQQQEWTRAPPRMVETLVEVNTLTVEEIDRQQEQPSSSRNRPILRLERRIRSHQKSNKQRQEEENAMEKAIQQCFSWKWPKDIMDSNQDGAKEEEDVPFDEKMDIPFDEEEDDVGNMPVTKKEEEDDVWPFGIDLKFMKRSSLAIATETSKTPAKNNTNNNKEVLSAAANTGTPDTAPMEEDEHQRQEEELVGMAATALSYSETPKQRTKTRSWRQRQRLQPMKKKGGDFISDLTFGLLSCNSKKPTTSPSEKKNDEEEDNDESVDEGGGFKGCHHHAIRELFCHSA
eukprot:scaffold133_cov115-Cylindrotheca_fusiformis.AAC.4